jgi:hypothetical protein
MVVGAIQDVVQADGGQRNRVAEEPAFIRVALAAEDGALRICAIMAETRACMGGI